MTQKVLVTGADGFIGSHLTEALVRSGHNVTALVQYNSFGSFGWLDECSADVEGQFEVVLGDIRDESLVQSCVKGQDALLHLAALIAIPYSYDAPGSYIETNVRGTLNVLNAARLHDVSRVVHTSTSEVYGTAIRVPIDESHPIRGQSPYAASKIGADQLAHAFYCSYGLPVVTLRPFNTYGPRQSARAVLPTIISQISSGARVIRLGSLTPTRDFNYVEDTVRGFEAALASTQAEGEVVNISSNFEISIAEAVDVISETMGVEIEVMADDARVRPELSEVDRLWGDNCKARRLFEWTPKYGGLEGFKLGIKKTVSWFEEPSNLSRYKAERFGI